MLIYRTAYPPPPPPPSWVAYLQLVAGALAIAARALRVAPPAFYTSPQVPNAQSDGRAIGVNLAWVEATLASACHDALCSRQVILGVMAHELCHHVWGDALNPYLHGHHKELRADGAAGWVLAELAIGSAHFERVIGHLSARPTSSHPVGWQRIQVIRAAYNARWYEIQTAWQQQVYQQQVYPQQPGVGWAPHW